MKRTLKAYARSWRMKEPFVIARGTQSTVEAVVVELSGQGVVGRGEAVGVPYRGETSATLMADIGRASAAIQEGAHRQELLRLMPAGGARNAVDAALWDLEARLGGVRAWQHAGMAQGGAVTTALTIGIRPIAAYEQAAARLADHPWIKIKVDRADPLGAVLAVRRGARDAQLVVDANQSWTVADLRSLGPAMAELGVSLLEQPVAVGHDEGLADLDCPVPICADESINTADDLPRLVGRYDFINIKLDKTGGLTAALDLARAAQRAGLRLMSGCMAGSSLAMAPAMVLAQICEINDLDGPWLQEEDWPGGIAYHRGVMSPPWPDFWDRAWGMTSNPPSVPALNRQKTRCVLTIDAEYDVQAPARILAFLTRGNALPERFSMNVVRDDAIRIVLELQCSDNDAAGLLAKRIANIPTVNGVSRVHS